MLSLTDTAVAERPVGMEGAVVSAALTVSAKAALPVPDEFVALICTL